MGSRQLNAILNERKQVMCNIVCMIFSCHKFRMEITITIKQLIFN